MKLRQKLFLLSALAIVSASAQWQPAGEHIRTSWSENIDVNNVHQEYPRPLVERARWMNLNGLWDYAVTPIGSRPQAYDGKILVPFAIESSLSGVGKRVTEKEELWYRRSFSVPANWKGEDVMLNFGAVDWRCDVWVNGIKVGSHTGGYTPFSMNITPALRQKGDNELVVKVWDGTDTGYQPRGKQVSKPGSIWYTPVTGIWQTVWMEPVAATHISDLRTTPDVDANVLKVDVKSNDADSRGLLARVVVKDADGKVVAEGAGINSSVVEVEMPSDVKLWSPDSPYLYGLDVTLEKNGKVVDKVASYAAMRKISIKRDADGIVRMQINNKDLFQFGPLDQGWWPDGLYTAPSHEALIYDIDKTKELGFNMIRKHVKVEPATWYAHCDKVGIIVWQDMPSGDKNPQWQMHDYFNGAERRRSLESENNYRKEWKEIIDYLYSYPCVGVWVPFNEAWGQFKCEEITEWTKTYDPSRLVNPASGGNHYHCGDILDMHNYPGPKMYIFDGERANVLGEYGGIGYAVKGHLWKEDKNWGYVQYASPKEVTDQYVDYAKELLKLIKTGYSAAVYTQTTDVEIEVNGFMTYDRKVLKMELDRVREINQTICNSLNK